MAEQSRYGTSTLKFRHFPSELSIDERKKLLYHLGASQAYVFGQHGRMKNTAFAVFRSEDEAKEIISQLHQVEFLGSKLVVEFAQPLDENVIPILDSGQSDSDRESKEKEKHFQAMHFEPKAVKFDNIFNKWGIKYPRRPDLYYQYPPPTPSILTNIIHTLAAVPRFYVQVLHLMNKMDLPTPFGIVTAAPPTHSDYPNPAPNDVKQIEMDISSSTESELESDDGERRSATAESKASKLILKKHPVKRPRLSDLKDHDDSLLAATPIQHIPISEIFETHQEGSSSTRKTAPRLPSTIKLKKHESRSEVNFMPQYPHSPLISGQDTQFNEPSLPLSISSSSHSDDCILNSRQDQEAAHTQMISAHSQLPQAEGSSSYPNLVISQQQKDNFLPNDASVEVVGGFGIMEPLQKDHSVETEEKAGMLSVKGKFLSPSELAHSRLSKSEMQELNVFKGYSEGQPSCRLYIKNLSRQVTEQDLHWIFGPYVNWDLEEESNIFDIRLMTEGRMKGQAFVTLPSEKSSTKALHDVNGFVLKEKPMVVQFARSAKGEVDQSSKMIN